MSWESWAKIGLVVGGYALFGPLGGAAGAYLGSAIWPVEYETEMPTVHDMPIQSSAVGIPISIVFGTARLAGNIIWMGDLQSYQIKHSSGGGKGGGDEQTTYETKYKRSFLIAICEGPVDEIKRAWKDKTLIPLTDFTSYTGDNNSGISTLIGENYAEYSNLCLAYFEDYELGNSQRIPNFLFEVGYSTDTAEKIVDYYSVRTDSNQGNYGNRRDGGTFTATKSHNIAGVELRLWRSGSPGTVTVEIWNTSGGLPTTPTGCSGAIDGNALVLNPAGNIGSFVRILFSSSLALTIGSQYMISVKCEGADVFNMVNISYAFTGTYPSGTKCYSLNQGVNWTMQAGRDVVFRTLEDVTPPYDVSRLYIGTDEQPAGNDLFELDYVWNKRHEETQGHFNAGIYDIVIQPSTKRIIVTGVSAKIYESDWSLVAILPLTALTMLIDPDDDDMVYLGGPGGIWKYKISTQVKQWQHTTYSAYGICISPDTGKLYISGITGDGINEIDRSTGAWVRNIVSTRGHGRIACHDNHIYATGSRQGSKSVWRYNESSGSLINSYDTGGATNRVVIWGGKIFVCGQLSGSKTIWKFNDILALDDSYNDNTSNYWLNDMQIDSYRNQLVVTSRKSVDEDGHTANVRWFDSSLNLQDDALIYDNVDTCVVTAIANNSYQVGETPSVDMNFAEMIKELLINEKYGGYQESDLITADFDDIITYCDDNDLKGSLAITSQKPLPDWIAYICSHFQGYFYEIGGKIGLNCYRSQASVLSIVRDDLLTDGGEPPVHTTKRSYSATFNRLEATWSDRDNDYKTAVVPAFDRIDQREAGQVRTKVLNLRAITDDELASKMTWRIFIDQIYRFSQYAFKLGYKSMLLEVGDVIDVTDGHKLVAKKMRVMSATEEKDGRKALITAVEDIADLYPAISYAIQQSEATPDTPIVLTDGTVAFRENWNRNRLYLSITPGGTQCNGFYIYRSYDDASYSLVGRASIENVTGGEANSTGTIQSNLPAYTAVVHRPLEFFDVSIGTITDLDTAITDDNFFNNRKLAKIGDEIIAYKTCVESSVEGTWRVSNLIRGLFGTEPVAHASGETFNTLDIDFLYTLQESDIGKTLYFKVVSFYAAKIQLLSEVSSQSYQVQGLYKRPAPASLLRLSSDEIDGGKIEYEGSSFTLYWNLPGQKGTGFNQGGFDLNDAYPEWRYGDNESELIGGYGVPFGNYLADDDLQGIDLLFEKTDGTFISQRSVAPTAQSVVISKADDLGGNASAVIKVYPRRIYRSKKAEPITVTGV